MRENIWECKEGHIHIAHKDSVFTFDNIYELIDTLSEWQNFTLFYLPKVPQFPEEVWSIYADAHRN